MLTSPAPLVTINTRGVLLASSGSSATTNFPSAPDCTCFACAPKRTVTSVFASAVPQTGTLTPRCNTIDSENGDPSDNPASQSEVMKNESAAKEERRVRSTMLRCSSLRSRRARRIRVRKAPYFLPPTDFSQKRCSHSAEVPIHAHLRSHSRSRKISPRPEPLACVELQDLHHGVDLRVIAMKIVALCTRCCR